MEKSETILNQWSCGTLYDQLMLKITEFPQLTLIGGNWQPCVDTIMLSPNGKSSLAPDSNVFTVTRV